MMSFIVVIDPSSSYAVQSLDLH